MSKALYSMFRTDKVVETEGILVNYGDVRFRVARSGGGNQKFKKVFAHEAKPYRRQIDNENISEEASDKLMAEVFAKSVILSWESVKLDEAGEPVLVNGDPVWVPTFTLPADEDVGREQDEVLDFTAENVVKVLLALPELFADLKNMAGKASNYRKAENEDDLGN